MRRYIALLLAVLACCVALASCQRGLERDGPSQKRGGGGYGQVQRERGGGYGPAERERGGGYGQAERERGSASGARPLHRALREVYAWKQLTFNINGVPVLQDRFGDEEEAARGGARAKRQIWQGEKLVFRESSPRASDWDNLIPQILLDKQYCFNVPRCRCITASYTRETPDSMKFFIQYNNVPMGVERWGNKLFVTVPRRRHGIPSTLNYLDLSIDTERSPGLRPYPSLHEGRGLVSVYRTRVDTCDRLWMVDTGLLEIPDARVQRQPPAIVVFDLKTNRQIFRYDLKSTDLVSDRTPAGLASITVDVDSGRCDSAFAYVPDLATYGLIVYSLKDNDSWRVSHNFFSFSPLAGNLNIAGQQFQWNDGVFSLTLGARAAEGGRTAYFHPMVSHQEFSVSTRLLQDRRRATREFHGEDFKMVGERGNASQSTMHAYHAGSAAILYAEVGSDALSCWNTRRPLTPENKVTLAQDHMDLVYPSDLHVIGNEVWLMANTMPRFIYSTLDTNQFNFRIYRGDVNELIAGTVCEPPEPNWGG